FRLTGGYSDQGTVFPIYTNYKKLTVGVKINHTSENKKWNLRSSGNYRNDKTRSTPTAHIMNAIYSPPIAPKLYNEDGNLHWEEWEEMGSSSVYNPLRSKHKMTAANTKTLIANLSLSYKIWKGLTFKTSMGYTENNREAISKLSLLYYNPSQRGVRNNLTASSIDHAKRNSWIVEPQLTYTTSLLQGTLDVLIGSTFQSNENISSNV